MREYQEPGYGAAILDGTILSKPFLVALRNGQRDNADQNGEDSKADFEYLFFPLGNEALQSCSCLR